MTPENAPGLVINRIYIVMRMSSVCRSDTDKSTTTRFDDIRHAELSADFNHFSTGQDDIASLSKDSHRQDGRSGIVVYDGGGFGICQRLQESAYICMPITTLACRDVKFDIYRRCRLDKSISGRC
jgi:hypothetical protein